MSGIVGLDALRERLSAYDEHLARRLNAAIERAAREFQADLVATCPVDQGDLRTALASPDGIRIRTRGGMTSIEVGLLTAEQKKLGFYAFFVEFGTKGYAKGDKRFAGRTKARARSSAGNVRMAKVNRDIPARPAHPFWRPAFARLVERLQVYRAEAHTLALMDMGSG